MYRYFIFDIDGTLIDTEKTCVLSLIQTVSQLMDGEMSEETAYGYFGIPSGKVGEVLGYHDPVHFGEVWEDNFIAISHLIAPFEGVDRVLSDIKAAGRRIGCVTSRNRFEFEKDGHLAKLLHFFDHTVCAEDSPRHKPFPDPLLSFMDMAYRIEGRRIDPKECIYIGDTYRDCQCSHAAGCDFALADWRGRGLQDMQPEYHFTVPSQITSTLLRNAF